MTPGVTRDDERRLTARRADAAALEQRHLRLGRSRIGLVTVTTLVAVVWQAGPGWWYLVPAALFVALSIRHGRTIAARDDARSAVAFYEAVLARRSGAWAGTGATGLEFRPARHPYADDLDLFGTGGLFELLATARTRAGEAALARWLLDPAEPDEVESRQAAVRELAGAVDLRERLAVLGDGQRASLHDERLKAWAAAPGEPSRTGMRWLLALLAAGVVAISVWCLATWEVPAWSARLLLVLLLAEGAIAFRLRHGVREATDRAGANVRDLELVSRLLELIERGTFGSPRLHRIQQALGGSNRRASAEIARLSRLIALLESRRNLMFAFQAALIAWGTQVGLAIADWRRRVGPHVPRWIEALGEFEALAAIGTFAAEHPDYVFPEFVGSPGLVEATGLAHPLLSHSAVPNDVSLGREHAHLLMVSGSNMSGKSTFLRALGTGVVLAQMGAPVRAQRFRLSPLAVGASIRVLDSLQDGTSRFYAEITRLRDIVELARTREGAALFLLDEILGGTNSHDRRQGADGVLTGLVGLGAIGLATTHDLALGAVADRLGDQAANVHFEDVFEQGVLRFDYRLRPGLVQTSNALALMRSVGLDV